MVFQLVDINSFTTFKRFSEKYNIFRDLYELGNYAIEIRGIENTISIDVHRIFLDNNELSYTKQISEDRSDLLVIGQINRLKEIANIIKSSLNEEIGFQLLNVILNYIGYEKGKFILANRSFPMNTPYIMGIINVTPDSFSDGGIYFDKGRAIDRAMEMAELGADIIDIGGESTRPGAESVDVDEELNRVIPVIEEIHKLRDDLIISIDTTKSDVAEKALLAGANIINDISGLTFDERMMDVVSSYKCSVIIMHIKGTPKTMQLNPYYNNIISDVFDFLYNRILESKKKLINSIIVDPGIGFGKRVEDNFELLNRLGDFKSLGYPIMVGVSRKSMFGKSLNLELNDREMASAITEMLAVRNGARLIRTHNVENAIQIKKIFSLINQPEKSISV